jgi:predicted DsbA family dithiol-disulfide isomerase
MTATVTIYSDVGCPWATVAIHRLRRARDGQDVDVVLDQRAWPLEWINEQGTPRHVVEPETALLASHEERLFSRFDGPSWPSTLLPALELVAAARRAFGTRAAEDVDYQARLAFFRRSADVSQRHVLHRVAADAGLDADAVMHVWETQPVRADVADDYRRSQQLPIDGSPQIFWPDGSTSHNPGMEHEWVRGLPRLRHADHAAAARLLAERAGGSDTGSAA